MYQSSDSNLKWVLELTDNYYKSIVKKVLLKKYLNIEVFSRDLDKIRIAT